MVANALAFTTLLLHWACFSLLAVLGFVVVSKLVHIVMERRMRAFIWSRGHESPPSWLLESFFDYADGLQAGQLARQKIAEVRSLYGAHRLNIFHLHWISRVLTGEIPVAKRPPRYAAHRMTA